MLPDKEAKPPCLFAIVAERKVGVPGWQWFKAEAIGDCDLITGCVPAGVYRSGKRKGMPKFDGKNATRVVVTKAEEAQAAADYERESGRCYRCGGRGETIESIGLRGKTYRQCGRCQGTGAA